MASEEIKPIYEFVLWNNCNNNCSFCFLKTSTSYQERILLPEEKVKSINRVVDFLQSSDFVAGSHVLLVGGEIFDESMSLPIQEAFYNLINLVCQKLLTNDIESLYINTNLMYENLTPLKYTLLDQLAAFGLLTRVHFTTSYDKKGRYPNQEKEDLFFKNISILNSEYKEKGLIICVNSILTNTLCKQIITKEYSRKQFADTYDVFVNLLPYIPYDKSLDVDRSLLLDALMTVGREDPEYFKYYVENFLLNQTRHVYEYIKTTDSFRYCSSPIGKCGHYESFKRFQGNDYCFLCDLQKLKDTLF